MQSMIDGLMDDRSGRLAVAELLLGRDEPAVYHLDLARVNAQLRTKAEATRARWAANHKRSCDHRR